MVSLRPLVNISGQTTELPPGDSIVGASLGTLTAGSGLDGGGNLSTAVTTNISLAANSSGLLFVDGKLGVDGSAFVTGQTALASGDLSLSTGFDALASGSAGSSLAATALASGIAAQVDINSISPGVFETFTAASAVVSGYAVGLDDGGNVQSLNSIVKPNSILFGSSATFGTYYNNRSATYNSSSNCIVVASSALNEAVAYVVTISGYSISVGALNYINFDDSRSISCVYDPTNDVVVFAFLNNYFNSFHTVVGTVSGTSITFTSGPFFGFGAFPPTSISTAYDSTNNRVVIAYSDTSNSNYGTAIVGTVSGTSLSLGTAVIFESSGTFDISSTYDSTNNRVVIAYRDNGNSNYGTAIVGTVSGTSISFGTAVVFESANTTVISSTYDSTNNRVVIAYRDNGNSNYGTAIVGTVSGTSISFGTAVVFESASTDYISTAYDFTGNRVVITYTSGGSSVGTSIVGTVSGTSISFGTAVVFDAGLTGFTDTVYNTASNSMVTLYDNFVSDKAVVSTAEAFLFPTVGSQNNFIGISQSTAASGSAVQVRLPGSPDYNNTGLTPGALYYVNPTTSGFTTTANQAVGWSGAVNWSPVGRAVNSTTLLLTDMI